MRIFPYKRWNCGITLFEVAVIVAVCAAVMVALLYPAYTKEREHRFRIGCVNNLKQTGMAFGIWSRDHTGEYPMEVPGTNGGSAEFITGPNAFRHFQVMSNELVSPTILICPSDRKAVLCPTNFSYLRNANLSYFVGVDASQTNATMILSGDRNIINDSPMKNGLLELTTSQPARWTSEMHDQTGNVVKADGSVEDTSIRGLQGLVANTGLATNRLQMPIPGP